MSEISSFKEKYTDFIEIFSLTEHELLAYFTLIKEGSLLIQELSKHSGIKRSTLYAVVEGLKSRHLVNSIRSGKRNYFAAEEPKNALEYYRQRLSNAETLLPDLLAIKQKGRQKPRVAYYEGIDGMEAVYTMMLVDKQTIYAWEDLDKMHEILPLNFFESYPKKRASLNIPFRSLIKDSDFARTFVQSKNQELARDSRLIQTDNLNTEINVFGDKTALFSLQKSNPFAVLIEDKAIAETLRELWRLLWEKSAN